MESTAESKAADRQIRYVLRPVTGGYWIERLRADTEFDPPVWLPDGFLNRGRPFATRSAARDYMLSGVER